jgi:phosphatidylethanolamine/phosphatidyl-N-methylethanolamine N-methyltransferase
MNAERLDFQADSFDIVLFSYVLSVVDDPARAVAEADRVLAPHGSIWILGRFYETPPGLARRLASRILTAVGGASLTRSLLATIAETPLRVNHFEHAGRLADIVQLVPKTRS